MIKKTSLVWFAAAGIAAAFFGAALTRQKADIPAGAEAPQNLFPFVRSLEGTKPDGNPQVGTDDALVVNEELVRLFDYYLSAIGEKPLDSVRQEIERELDRRFKPAPAADAKAVLARYLGYKQALADVEKNPAVAGNGIAAVRGRLLAMQQVRAQFFSAAEIAAMFRFEDAYHADALARLEISQDRSLSEVQKAERLAALDAALLPELRDARDAPLQIARLEEAAGKLRNEGASEDDVYRMRAAVISPEAAARMAEVDREEAAWMARIHAYLAERNRLLGGLSNASVAQRDAALQQLRQARFDEDEQKRLPAYE